MHLTIQHSSAGRFIFLYQSNDWWRWRCAIGFPVRVTPEKNHQQKKSILCPQQPNLEMKNNKIKVKFWQHTMNNILLLLFIVCGAYEFSMSCQTTLFLLNNRKRDIKLKTNKQKINRNIKPSHLTTTKFSVVHCKCEECHRQSVKSWMPIDWLVAIAIMAQQQTYWVLEYMSLWTDICTTHTHTHLMSYAITYR